MLSKLQKDEECDTTEDASSTSAGNTKNITNVNLCLIKIIL